VNINWTATINDGFFEIYVEGVRKVKAPFSGSGSVSVSYGDVCYAAISTGAASTYGSANIGAQSCSVSTSSSSCTTSTIVIYFSDVSASGETHID